MSKKLKIKTCSICYKKCKTVDRKMFDGMCCNCTEKALWDYEISKKAKKNNIELYKLESYGLI